MEEWIESVNINMKFSVPSSQFQLTIEGNFSDQVIILIETATHQICSLPIGFVSP